MWMHIMDRMFLRLPAWAEGFLQPSPSSAAFGRQTSIEELVVSLTNQRHFREIVFALRTGLREARAEFSFLRVRGLKKLASFLTSAADSKEIVQLFQISQGQQELQVVPTLFHHTLSPPKTTTTLPLDPVSSTSPPMVLLPPTTEEIILALRVLEGCCLLDPPSRALASQHMGVKEILELLCVGGVLERIACLDALLPLLLDSPANQKDFEHFHGIQKIVDLIQNKHVDRRLRLRCIEYLLLFVGQMLPCYNSLHGDGRKQTVTRESIRVNFCESFGSEASFVWDTLITMLPPSDIESQLYSNANQLLEMIDTKSSNS